MTPQGLELRLSWGDHVLAQHFLTADRESSFTVGSAPGCHFAMSDEALSGERFEVARGGPGGFEVRFPRKLARSGDFPELIELGRLVPDGDGYVMSLDGDGAGARVELGAISVEAAVRPCPERVSAPLGDQVDFRTLNIFVVLLALAGAFVVSALNREAEGDEWADELSANAPRLVKLLVKPPLVPVGAPARQPAEERPSGGGAPAVTAGPERPRPEMTERERARLLTDRIFTPGGLAGGVSAILGEGGDGELRAAIQGLVGRGSTAALEGDGGFGGLGLRGGPGGGGGPGEGYRIGALGTRGRGGGRDGYGTAVGLLCGGGGGKAACLQRDKLIVSSEPEVMGGLDQELVRQVIRQHRDQIRYCYEVELAREQSLRGKVAVKFVISATGLVASTSVAQSTVQSPELESCVAGRVRTWVFPRPKNGGVVVVTYPFLFAQSGA